MAYTYYRSVTLSEALSGTANSTDFPVTFTGTYAYLATVANGGKVENANGYDIAFFSDSGLTTPLDFELVTYTATTGFIEAHFRVGTLSASTDTVVYMAYGDSGISTFQGDVAGTWNSDFNLVYHGGDGTTLSTNDSTSNAYNGTNNGTAAVAGKVGGALDFVRASSDTVSLASTGIAALMYNRPFTISCWIYRNSTGDTQAIWGGGSSGTIDGYILFRINSEKLNLVRSKEANIASSTTNVPSGAWAHVAVTYDSSNNYVFYLNGSADGSGSAGTGFNTSTNRNWALGADGGGDYLNAYLDEMRKSSVIRSSSWITAEYNNTSSPSTFYTIGSEVGGSAPTATGSGSFAVAGSGTALVAVAATGTGSCTVAGSGTGTVAVSATGTGSFTASGSGTAAVGNPPVDATGTGSFTVAGSGTGTVAVSATGTGSFTVAGSGEAIAGFAPAIATGSGSFTVAGSGTATVPISATGTGSVTASGSGTATVAVTASGSGSFSISGVGEAISGFAPAIGTGAGSFTLSGTATATVLVQGVAVGLFVVEGSGLATIPIYAVGAGTFTASGSGTALSTTGIPPSTALRAARRSGVRYLITPRPRP